MVHYFEYAAIVSTKGPEGAALHLGSLPEFLGPTFQVPNATRLFVQSSNVTVKPLSTSHPRGNLIPSGSTTWFIAFIVGGLARAPCGPKDAIKCRVFYSQPRPTWRGNPRNTFCGLANFLVSLNTTACPSSEFRQLQAADNSHSFISLPL